MNLEAAEEKLGNGFRIFWDLITMTDKIRKILDKGHKYNTADLAYINFGLDSSVKYDALVVAPSFTPYSRFPEAS